MALHDVLTQLWSQPEGESIEWKPSLSQTESIYKAICAFSNNYRQETLFEDDLGSISGVIFVGRQDDGTCADTSIDDETLRNFIGRLHDVAPIMPFPSVNYERWGVDGCAVVALIVRAASSTPVHYAGTIYVRQGSRSQKATPTQTIELTRRRQRPSFDASFAVGATVKDLDLRYLEETYVTSAVSREVLEDNGRSLEEQLAALRILTPDYRPTYLGVLIGGKNPRAFLPNAYVQFRRVNGIDLADETRDHQEISGRIDEAIRRTLDKVRANIEVAQHITPDGVAVDTPNYPFLALRELILNAFVHRDYQGSNAPIRITWFDDRIEVHNPGGPFGSVTDGNFGNPNVTDYRNPELAYALKYLGYVERFGSGIGRVRRELERNGNPPVRFDPRKDDNYVLATVYVRARG